MYTYVTRQMLKAVRYKIYIRIQKVPNANKHAVLYTAPSYVYTACARCFIRRQHILWCGVLREIFSYVALMISIFNFSLQIRAPANIRLHKILVN